MVYLISFFYFIHVTIVNFIWTKQNLLLNHHLIIIIILIILHQIYFLCNAQIKLYIILFPFILFLLFSKQLNAILIFYLYYMYTLFFCASSFCHACDVCDRYNNTNMVRCAVTKQQKAIYTLFHFKYSPHTHTYTHVYLY